MTDSHAFFKKGEPVTTENEAETKILDFPHEQISEKTTYKIAIGLRPQPLVDYTVTEEKGENPRHVQLAANTSLADLRIKLPDWIKSGDTFLGKDKGVIPKDNEKDYKLSEVNDNNKITIRRALPDKDEQTYQVRRGSANSKSILLDRRTDPTLAEVRTMLGTFMKDTHFFYDTKGTDKAEIAKAAEAGRKALGPDGIVKENETTISLGPEPYEAPKDLPATTPAAALPGLPAAGPSTLPDQSINMVDFVKGAMSYWSTRQPPTGVTTWQQYNSLDLIMKRLVFGVNGLTHGLMLSKVALKDKICW